MSKRFRRRRRTRKTVGRLVFLAMVIVAALWFARFDDTSLEGRALIADGDSLEVGGKRVRLVGIDAPELSQQCEVSGRQSPCGRQARDHLRRLVGRNAVVCSGFEHDRYDRLLAHCRAGNIELNRRMVADGWAVAYGDYEAEEDVARQTRSGLWAGDFDMPRQWRKDHPRAGDDDEGGRRLITVGLRWLSDTTSRVFDWIKTSYPSTMHEEDR